MSSSPCSKSPSPSVSLRPRPSQHPSLGRDGVRQLEFFCRRPRVRRGSVVSSDKSALVSRTLVVVTVAAAVCGHQVALVGVVIVCLGVGTVDEEVADLALDDLKGRTRAR